ncbi:phospholipase A2-like [Leguminivora glycinivorella]|uniref:phospholipase A2-like n=1 Tax=Leguminivora glycinivorella TaxID=1035111 RepID=UPI00200C580A|nr:phospholipase A2-like [Leguminivora glycinivorella]
MFAISCLFVIIMFESSTSWVINDVNLSSLRERGLIEDSDEVNIEERFSLIYPGTKWCGAGNIADGYDDLGPSRETDMCCRDHDNCPDYIAAGETKHNLTNNAFYTRLNCECDEKFRLCLRAAAANKSKVAKQIGTVYFNALGTECYREDYPVVGCVKKGGWFNRKCLEPKYDKNGERRYQWFDVPNY